MRIFSIGILALVCLVPGFGADYFIAPDGDDRQSGSLTQPWGSLARANEALMPGDTVFLRGGNYSGQQIKPVRSGIAGRPITYAAYEREQPVLTEIRTAIDLTDRSHVVVDGIHVDGGGIFEDATVGSWLWMMNSHHNIIRNCRFQYARGWSGVRIDGGSRFNRILNNRMDCTGSFDKTNLSVGGQRTIGGRIPPELGGGDDAGDLFDLRDASSNLIEGNHLSRGGHSLFTCIGDRNVIRGNVFENRWGESEDPDHVYGPGAKGNRNGALTGKNENQGSRNLYEGNFVVYSYPASDQPLLTAALKVETFSQIVRRNVFYYNQNVVISTVARGMIPEALGSRIFHNTFYGNGGPAWRIDQFRSGRLVDDNEFKNNLVYGNRRSPPTPDFDFDLIFSTLNGNRVVANSFARNEPGDARFHVAGFGGQTVAWYEDRFPENFAANLEAAPLFVTNEPNRFADFALAAGSPQIDAGAFLTRTRGAGEGKVLPVRDAGYFFDGFEIVEGDLIQLEGTTEAVRIRHVDYQANEIHLERAIPWTKGQGVALQFAGRAPDMGAFEFGLTR